MKILEISGESVPLSGKIKFDRQGTAPEQSLYSVLIGINGVGKSRLLSQVAEAFIHLTRHPIPKIQLSARRPFPFTRLIYEIGGEKVVVASSSRRFVVTVDGQNAERDIPLPARIIALTATAFDKFRVPRNLGNIRYPNDTPEIYSYLGLRDAMGRSSMRALLYRSLDALISTIESDTNGRIHARPLFEVFKTLNYDNTLTVEYVLQNFSPLARAARGGLQSFEQFVYSEDLRPGFRSNEAGLRIRRQIERGEYTLQQFVDAYSRAYSSEKRSVQMRLTFEKSVTHIERTSTALNDDLKLLRRGGILELRHVVLQREGSSIELMQASSGEISLAVQFIGLAACLEPDSLVLIDEPEVSLHPEWQRRYLELIQSCFKKIQNSHFAVATHSPLILADFPRGQTDIISLDGRGDSRNINDLFGESADYVLVNAFGEAAPSNYYLKDLVAQTLLLARNNEMGTKRFMTLLSSLERVQSSMGSGPMHDIISDISNASAEFAKNK